MEINITKFFNEAAPMDYSASCAEIGDTAGPDTWRAACDDAGDWNMLDTEDKRDAFREWVKGYGAWDDEEITAWSDTEVNALFIQWVAGDIREGFEGWNDEIPEGMDKWVWYEQLAESGRISSNLFKGDDDQVYFTLY